MSSDRVPIETIRLSDREKQKLLEYVEQRGRRPIENDRRNLRVDFHSRRVLVTIVSQQGQRIRHAVLPRNLSRRGLAFVHGRFVYPDSVCEVTLPMQDGKWALIKGTVRSCRHVSGIIHEVAVVFDEPLHLSDYVRLSPTELERYRVEQSQDAEAETQLDPGVVGRALLIDDAGAERKLHRLWLQKLHFDVSEAHNLTAARERLESSEFDLVILNLELTQESATNVIDALRAEGFRRPIVVTSSRENDQTATPEAVNAKLDRPFTAEQLAVTIERVMGDHSLDAVDSEPIYSTVADDQDMALIIEEFVEGLSTMAVRLRRAAADSDLDTVSNLCHGLKSAGSGYGFDILTDSARNALDSLDAAEQDTEKVRRTVNELVQIMKRIKCAA